MEITPMQNNQSFGMAFRLQGNGAKKMATSIVESKVPQTTNDFFVNQIIEPIQKLKSEVIYDGEKVLVKNEELKKDSVIEVLDNNMWGYIPFSPQNARFMEFGFHVNIDGKECVYKIQYPERNQALNNELVLLDGDDCKLLCAREIAKDLDAQLAKKTYAQEAAREKAETIKNIANKLQELYG